MVRLLALVSIAVLLVAVSSKKKSEPDPDLLNPEDEQIDPKDNAEYHTDKKFVEGDMIVKGGNKEDRNAVNDDKKLWPNGVVPYMLLKDLSEDTKQLIERSIKDYSTYTCVRFVKRNQEKNYAFFTSRGGGCYAYLGMWGGAQPINIGRGCEAKGVVMHEMMHTMGFAHEQSRNDRDQYIRINWHNMNSAMRSQFTKMNNERNLGTPYDLKSVMHYGPWGFSKNGDRVIDTVDPKMRDVIGQRKGFSKIDAQEINKLYRCGGGGRPVPTIPTDAPRVTATFGACKDAPGNYCYNTVLATPSFCTNPLYRQMARRSCCKYCRLG